MEWEEARLRKQRGALNGRPNGEAPVEDVTWKGNMNQWADQTKNKYQFGYDAYAAANEWWNAGGEKDTYGS
jgi:hypothetical protein